jgi:hypothetical protein
MDNLPIKIREVLPYLICANFSIFFFLGLVAQSSDIIAVSYQELTTRVRSQSVDEAGNTYYAGIFKGALVVNSDTLAYGKGGDDYFLLKVSNLGAIEWVIPFGSIQNESQVIKVLHHAGYVYLSFAFPHIIEIENLTIPLLKPTGLTNCLIQLDADGNINWFKRSNLPFTQLLPMGDNIMASCTVGINAEPLLMESENIFNPNGFNNQVFIQVNKDGNNTGNFFVHNEFNANSQVNVLVRRHPNLNQVYFWFYRINSGMQNGNQSINFNGTSIPFASNQARQLLARTDTFWNITSTKTLDENGSFLFSGGFDDSRLRFNGDSSALHLSLNSGIFANDGFNENLNNKNAIVEIDFNLVTKNIFIINSNPPINGQQSVRLNYVQQTKDNYFILGQVTGRNQSPPIVPIPQDLSQIQLLNDYSISFDLNGPSRSFLIRTNKNFDFEDFVWVTDQSFLENSAVGFIDFINTPNHIQFLNPLDNEWNPWKIKTDMEVVRGTNKYSADQTDYIERVKYFPNGTRALFGLANGLTAFDESDAGIVKAGNRRDFFYAFIDSNNQLLKYNRLFSSFGVSNIRSVQIFNDSIFVLLRILSPRNQAGFNFIKIGDFTQVLPGNIHTVMIGFDTVGNFKILDMQNTPIGPIISFDIFPNGDFAFLSENTNISLNHEGKIFPNRVGFYIIRSPKTGGITHAMKLFPSSGLTNVSANDIMIEKSNENILININGSIAANGPDFDIVTARHGDRQTILNIPNASPGATTRKYYNIILKTTFSQDKFARALGPFTPVTAGHVSIASYNETSYITFYTGSFNDTVKFNNQIILPEGSTFNSCFLSIDKDGDLINKTIFEKVPDLFAHSFRPVRLSMVKNNLYLMGISGKELNFGALKIPYKAEGDGIILKFDTAMNLIQFFSLASLYSDICLDIDVFSDSSLIIAYQSQGLPTQSIGLNQISFLNSSSKVSPSDFEESGFVSQIAASIIPTDFIFTIKQGEWHDPTIWNTGKVPGANDRIFVRHKVQILQHATCFQIFVDPTAILQLMNGVALEITGKPTL